MFGAKKWSEANKANRGLAAWTSVGPPVDGFGLHDGAVAGAKGVRLKPGKKINMIRMLPVKMLKKNILKTKS